MATWIVGIPPKDLTKWFVIWISSWDDEDIETPLVMRWVDADEEGWYLFNKESGETLSEDSLKPAGTKYFDLAPWK